MQLSLFEQTVLTGVAKTGSTQGCYFHVADSLNLSKQDMQTKVYRGQVAGEVGYWQHKIRSTQQVLKSKGLIENKSKRGDWGLTLKGRNSLTQSKTGKTKLYFTTKNGMAFWGDSSLLTPLFHGEVDLIITSPPYLLTNAREYGHFGNTEQQYVENLITMIEGWLPMLTSTASVVINLGDSIKKGQGYQNLHKERLLIALEDKLGLHLIQKFIWHSPTKMPTGYWVTKARRDCVQKTEEFLWLSLNPKSTKANNRRVLQEYTESQKRLMESQSNSTKIRLKPSGQSACDKSFYKDNGGAIPGNLLSYNPEHGQSEYSCWCKEQGLPRHPAAFNYKLPEFFVKYLTETNDVVFDPFFGSGSSGYASEINERHWIGGDITKEYLDGAMYRFKKHQVSMLI